MTPRTSPKEFATVKPQAAAGGLKPNRVCHCGRVAHRKKMNSWVCPRCDRIENEHHGGGVYRSSCGKGWSPDYFKISTP